MASTFPDPAILGAPEGDQGPLKFTLQIMSPSSNVPQPLIIQSLPATATVKELKHRLRNILEARPSDQSQRLIHRGRLLAREEETMLNVFGEETLRSADLQTLHLVLRDQTDHRTAPTATATQTSTNPSPGGAQSPAAFPTQAQPHHHHHHHHHPTPQAGTALPHTQARLGGAQWPIAGGAPFGQNFPATIGIASGVQPINLPPGYTPQQFAQHQRQWLATMNAQRDQRRMDILNQNQRDRPGAQDPSGTNSPARTGSPLDPDTMRTFVREGVTPNGGSWRITVNETVLDASSPRQGRTGSPFAAPDMQGPWRPPSNAPQPRSVPVGGQFDLQNILRTADANQATRTMTDAMRRNASTSSLSNLASSQSSRPVPPGVTTPSFMAYPARSAAGTPVQTNPFNIGRVNNVPGQRQAQAGSGTPEVYILSSPNGPRAILLNGNLETYFTPQTRPSVQSSTPQQPPLATTTPGPTGTGRYQSIVHLPATQINPSYRPPAGARIRNRVPPHAQQQQQQQQQPEGQQQGGLPPPPQNQPQPGQGAARPDNAQVDAVRVANLLPVVWGLTRLSLFLFIWWYTSPTASWGRLIAVMFIAATFFLANAGLLAPLTGQLWAPLRQNLENLMPLADGHPADRRRQQQQQQNGQAARAGDGGGGAAAAEGGVDVDAGPRRPDPAETAARLVHQHRERNANWLANQVRRLERAGILFLASIAPGVAERHIAQLEADARAERERQRREQEEEAAEQQRQRQQEQDREREREREQGEEAATETRNEDSAEQEQEQVPTRGSAATATAESTAVEQRDEAGANGGAGEGIRARAPYVDGAPVDAA